MDSVRIEDIIKTKPEKEFKTGGFLIQRWFIDAEEFDKYFLERKHFLSKQERVDIWIDSFTSVFGDKISSDAKRIAFDLFNEHHLKTTMAPSTTALVCLNISCEFHDTNFDAKVFDIIDVLKREKKKFIFGKEFSGNYMFAASTNRIMIKIKERSINIKKELGPEKFKKIKDMWRGIDG